MQRIAILGCVASAMLCGQTGGPASVTVVVRGTSNPYLAGMPDGTRGRFQDISPEESPVFVNLPLAGATAVTFSAFGGVAHGPMWPIESAEGSHVLAYHIGSEHRIAGLVAPFESLVGVFLGDDRPDRGRAPRGLTFREKDTQFTTLKPELKQIFFIGSGMTKSGAVRRFLIPRGATRLFLGTMDEYGWYNNIGSLVVTIRVESPDVTSNLFSVDSSVNFADWDCLPDHRRCTPGRAMVQAKAPGVYHVLLPAQLEWGASVPNTAGVAPMISGAKGSVCLDSGSESCTGPEGKGQPGGDGYITPFRPPGALVAKTVAGRTWFSVNGRGGPAFQGHDGFFEFDVALTPARR